MVSSESAVRWRRASAHHWRNWASLGAGASVASCRSSSSIAANVLGGGVIFVLETLVSLDNALHQRVTHHVFRHEMREADARHVLEYIDHLRQPRLGALGQVDLGHVTGDNGRGTETDTGEEHLHLFD